LPLLQSSTYFSTSCRFLKTPRKTTTENKSCSNPRKKTSKRSSKSRERKRNTNITGCGAFSNTSSVRIKPETYS
jgi:hypothetical protein